MPELTAETVKVLPVTEPVTWVPQVVEVFPENWAGASTDPVATVPTVPMVWPTARVPSETVPTVSVFPSIVPLNLACPALVAPAVKTVVGTFWDGLTA